MCTDKTLARYAREHNGANVLALGATLVTVDDAMAIVDTWLGTPMGEARYIRRLAKIRASGEDRSDRLSAGHRASSSRSWRAAGRRGAGAVRLSRVHFRLLPGSRAAACSMPARRASACMPPTAAPAACRGLIDHTLLKPDATATGDRAAVPRSGGVANSPRSASIPTWVALRGAATARHAAWRCARSSGSRSARPRPM